MFGVTRGSPPAALVAWVALLTTGCGPSSDGTGIAAVLTADDAAVISRFKELHTPIYRVYALGPDRDAIHDLLSSSFIGRALTREYVEHYVTIVRMLEERTAIEVIKVDYEDVRIVDRTRREVRLDVDWSVGGLVTHQNHQHIRLNRYRAVYTLAQADAGLRITDTRVRNSQRLRGMPYTTEGWPLDERPSSSLGFMDPAELLRAGVGQQSGTGASTESPPEPSEDLARMTGTERFAVRATDLGFSYPGRRRGTAPQAFRLRCPRWEVRKGERVAVTGPSGCGKTTLLNLVAGVLSPDQGQLEVEGRELSTMSDVQRRAHRIRNMGFVFQDFPLVTYLGAEENVLLPYRLNDALSLDRSARQHAGRLLDDLGISGRKRSRPDELSQGERQRVAIARALITEPSLLLADEPTAGLDPDRSTSVMELLEHLSTERDLTLIMVTHDPAVITRFDHVLDVAQLAHAVEAEP